MLLRSKKSLPICIDREAISALAPKYQHADEEADEKGKHEHTTEPIFGDFGLFTFMSTMQSDNGPRGPARCGYVVPRTSLDDDFLVDVPSIDLEFLRVGRFIVDKDSARHFVIVTRSI